MKKPSVRSRCGSVCRCCGMVGCFQTGASAAQVVGREVVVGGQERRHDVLVLGGRDRAGRVDEGTAGLRTRRRPAARIRACSSASASGRPALRQRASGRDGERAEVAARRVDEHAVEGRRRLRLGGVAGAHVDDVRAHARGGAAQRVGAAGVALDGDDLALVAHQRGEVRRLAAGRGAQVEHALAGLRVERRARRPSRRATAASAGPPPTPASRRRRTGASRISASPSTCASGPAGARPAPRRAILSVLARSAASAGSLSAAISARASAAPSASNHSSAIHSGCECASAACAGVRVGQRVDERPRLARGAAQDGVDEAGAARRVGLGQLDRLADRGVRGHAVEKGQLEDPEPQRGQHRRVELGGRPAGERLRSRGRAWPRAGRCRSASCVASARSRASSRRRRASPCSARSAHASCSNTRRTTAYAHARAGATPRGSAPDGRRFLHASLYGAVFCLAAFTSRSVV